MILFSHPTGNANVRHAALGLRRAGLLGEYWTSLDYHGAGGLGELLPRGLEAQLRRRSNPVELLPFIRTRPGREMGRLLASRLGLSRLVRHETGLLSVDAVYHALDRAVARRLEGGGFAGVYAYEDGAAESFRVAARRGLRRFYDQPIGHWKAARTLLTEEAALQPAWAPTLIGNRDSDRKTARKDEELALADIVFVASSFTANTLRQAGHVKAPVVVLPYGSPHAPAMPGAARERRTAAPLRALFVGGLSQRKGLSYLFDAAAGLRGAVELTVVGAKPPVECPELDRALARARWIPSCPHAAVLEEMRRHDVLVFPSLFEGFGLVLLEAMAMGLPIITTPHTAGPDLITDGMEGYLVPIRSSSAIMERLETLRREPGRLAEMSRQSQRRAAEFTWEAYGRGLAAEIAARLGPDGAGGKIASC